MKSITLILITILVATSAVFGQYDKQLSKARKKQYDSKVKELKKANYEIVGSKTLDVALLEHYKQLDDPNNQEVVGISEDCPSINVCRTAAQAFAFNLYAGEKGSFARGKIAGEIDMDVEKFVSTFDQLYAKNLSDAVTNSFTILKKTKEGKNSVQVFYLVNMVKAKEIARSTVDQALEKTNSNLQYGEKIKKYLDDAFKN